jgi:hypothetical protein
MGGERFRTSPAVPNYGDIIMAHWLCSQRVEQEAGLPVPLVPQLIMIL